MVLKLDGNSKVSVQVSNKIHFFYLKNHLIISIAVTSQIFFTSKKTLGFLHACATISELPSNIYHAQTLFTEKYTIDVYVFILLLNK